MFEDFPSGLFVLFSPSSFDYQTVWLRDGEHRGAWNHVKAGEPAIVLKNSKYTDLCQVLCRVGVYWVSKVVLKIK